MTTMNDNFIDKEITDHEFDKWLSNQLKDEMISPPEDFTSKVMTKLEMPRQNGQIDPLMLLILVAFLLVNGGLLAFPYILSEEWLQKISGMFLLETYTQISSANIIISAVVAIGLLFVGLDFLLSKRFGGPTINIA